MKFQAVPIRYCRTPVQVELHGLHQWNGMPGNLGVLEKACDRGSIWMAVQPQALLRLICIMKSCVRGMVATGVHSHAVELPVYFGRIDGQVLTVLITRWKPGPLKARPPGELKFILADVAKVQPLSYAQVVKIQ